MKIEYSPKKKVIKKKLFERSKRVLKLGGNWKGQSYGRMCAIIMLECYLARILVPLVINGLDNFNCTCTYIKVSALDTTQTRSWKTMYCVGRLLRQKTKDFLSPFCRRRWETKYKTIHAKFYGKENWLQESNH